METNVKNKFTEMGSDVLINELDGNARFNINIRNGKFILNKTEDVGVQIIDFDKKDRHLLLLASVPTSRSGMFDKQRYLCGHDERDWFTCGIPTVVKTVFEAKETLKPKELRELERGTVKQKDKQKRHRKAKGIGTIHRQGEFMFIPQPDWNPDSKAILRKKEPMRQNGRPHVAEEVVRMGGRKVYTRGSRVIEVEAFKIFQENDPKEASKWKAENANPTVYARGTIRHPDHKTLDLGNIWHKVLVNTEQEASFIRNVLFID